MAPGSSGLRRLAPAKVNLALHVVGRRDDGYHLLESLVAFTRFGDRISLEPAEETTLKACGPFADQVPLDSSNLILRAHDLLAAKFPSRQLDAVSLTLEKNLPVASGIGGGSSDAAAASILLARHWNLELADEELASLTLSLGSDVPMCVTACPLIARGTGDQIERIKLPKLPLVLVNPGEPLSTPAVFNALERKDNPPLPARPGMETIADVVSWLRQTRNDLEAPAASLAPSIHHALEELSTQNAVLARMSGSGATCFGIFQSDEDAEQAAKAIARRHPSWFVVATSTFASDEAVP